MEILRILMITNEKIFQVHLYVNDTFLFNSQTLSVSKYVGFQSEDFYLFIFVKLANISTNRTITKELLSVSVVTIHLFSGVLCNNF
ncbi:CLUMA_CG002839, isoform A [Clunio marinus]|uniref:CLUMA_CG002839, isoform A n=1 Tax=Clunio marinus TaxID=568069 RepID=A0A1J1HMZ1_9DIPT|nr:CLUMA_CG002839, isoform A [Clunio marinus]